MSPLSPLSHWGHLLRAAVLAGVALGLGAPPVGGQGASGFDHAKHRRVFATCMTCHLGAQEPDSSMWPDPQACATCHDGVVQPRVAWRPPEELRPSNLKFLHDLVPLMTRSSPQGPVALTCRDCHIAQGEPWMAVRAATPEGCLECHGTGAPHLAAPDTLCTTCHLPLAGATTLTRTDIAAFPAPPSHRQSRFASPEGHGALAIGTREPVAPSCSICHARDFCLTCHVDAPEQRAVQGLEPDPRATAIAARLAAPASHRDATFLQRHGSWARRAPQDCRTCHTQESCLTCHVGTPRVAEALHRSSPDRGAGGVIARRPPSSHVARFADRHRGPASSRPQSCAGCHVQPDCLQCHRPGAASAGGPGGPRYHPAGFLARHPAAAYARETSCSDCHSVGSFCASCHANAGLVAPRPLSTRYHDAQPFFIAGHGAAARQSLETCVGCHTERDCLTCHSALGGRRFNPHGPGFDAARLKRKNPEMCTACHGAAIPGP